jgi:Dyp-type peroxidase family
MTRSLDLSAIQGNVVRGYGHAFRHVGHLFGQIPGDPAAVEAWRSALARLSERVTFGEWGDGGKPEYTLNLGLSFGALTKLRPDAAELSERFPAFAAGFSGRELALGESRLDVLPIWREREVWFSVHAQSSAALERGISELRAHSNGIALQELSPHGQAWVKEDGHWYEHFGFRDDVSNPTVAGAPVSRRRADGAEAPIAAGEIVLGYENERGVDRLAGVALPLRALFDQGTFGVFCDLEQHVARFWEHLSAQAHHYGVQVDWLAEKLVGRRRNGESLAVPGETTNFDYRGDESGSRCPIGAHVRRSNPRKNGEHRLMRRGVPYGRPLEYGAVDDGTTRGLYFVVFNASIEDQFEFVQQVWLNGPAGKLRNACDALVGSVPSGDRKLLIEPESDGSDPVLLLKLPHFVTNRGGQYYLLPGRRGLEAIARKV